MLTWGADISPNILLEVLGNENKQWFKDIPKELEKAEIISIKKQPNNYTKYQRLKSFLWIKKLQEFFLFYLICKKDKI